MKISILSHNFSTNCLGRAYILAEVLSRKHEVEIIGPVKEKGIWEPLKNSKITLKSVPYSKFPGFISSIKQILEMIDGDIIYAVKPRPSSFGIALIKKLQTKKPVILDIDDLEDAYSNKKSIIENIRNPESPFYLKLVKNWVKQADEITTVSQYLKDFYGGRGTFVPHGRDLNVFNPGKFNSGDIKKKYGLENKKVIIFGGTALSHKGIEDIVSALNILNNDNYCLALLGAVNSLTKRLCAENNSRIIALGQTPFDQVPERLSMADLIVLPQRNVPKAFGQIPAKLIDAMAMEKPIIASNISDISKILDGCGITVEPGNTKELAEKIDYMFNNPEVADKMAKAAREKCERCYSYDIMEATLNKIISEINI